jgi:hypothetical protein
MQRIINSVFVFLLVGLIAGFLIFDSSSLSSLAPKKSPFETTESTGSLIGILLFLTGLISAILKFPAVRRTLLGARIIIVGAIGMIASGKLGALIAAAF